MNRELTNVQAEYAVRYLRKLAGIKNSRPMPLRLQRIPVSERQQIRSMVREMAKQACQR
jgi:hypothetical protein